MQSSKAIVDNKEKLEKEREEKLREKREEARIRKADMDKLMRKIKASVANRPLLVESGRLITLLNEY